MDTTDRNTIENLEKEKWISRERLISKTSKIIVNTLVTTLLTASCDNLYALLKKYATQELEENASEEEQMKVYNQAANQILNKCYKDPEIADAISYDTYGTTKNTDIIREFQDTISKAVINTYDVQRSDSKGKYIIKNLFEAYNTNPQ